MKAELLVATQKSQRGAVRHRTSTKRGFPQLWHFATEYVIALPLGALIALVWANTDVETYYRVVQPAAFLVNDVAMVAFFALITKEIMEATAPGGVLHPWRHAALPVFASLGLAVVPVVLFSVLVRVFDEPMLVRGWTAALAVDIALGYFVARIIFGRHPATAFFLLLAISANGLGFMALAIVDPIKELRLVPAITLMLAAIGAAFALRRAKVRSFWPYVIIGGGLSWSALFVGGFHPALALLPIVPFIPHAARDPGFFVDAPARAADALNRLERWFRHPAQAALFGFGLVNGGVPFGALEAGVWSLPLATLAGKPLGLLVGVALGTALGLHLPRDVRWRDMVPLGFISAAGFTMALFFATATIGPGQMLSELNMGAVLSVGSCIVAVGMARLLGAGRFGHR
jgi:Na+:H+ antiporter, NhaA family